MIPRVKIIIIIIIIITTTTTTTTTTTIIIIIISPLSVPGSHYLKPWFHAKI